MNYLALGTAALAAALDNLDGRKPMYWNRDYRRRLKLN
jgi:hypothetical protein